MNSSQYTYLLENPEIIDTLETQQLEEIVKEFPYFQSARALLLNGFNKSYSYKYNPTLKKTAAYTIDRKVLFNFITSPIFIHKTIPKIEALGDIENFKVEIIDALHKKIMDTADSEVNEIKPSLIQKEIIEEITQKATEILEIGKPIQFNSTEPHSFNEWMQLISQKPIVRDIKTNDTFNIIDKFIESKPKIKPVDKNAINIDISLESSKENSSLMTETLAKVYLEQMKYENAIKAYRILCLKYPEKSSFFAD
ncbi:MAG: hypothetical protein HQ490_03265, partial [Lutibacter sp.]|nr:hypothetical protein [Lutibacter sp.]